MKKKPMKADKILIANGVNLDLLGKREPQIYGFHTLKDVEDLLHKSLAIHQRANPLSQTKLVFLQTNSEEKFLEEFDKGYAGIVINAGAWTHTSLAIADRLRALAIPYVEVHISDLRKRESFRQHSYLEAHAVAVVQGLGIKSYAVGLETILKFLNKKQNLPSKSRKISLQK